MADPVSTAQKAVRINRDPDAFGTFAEIGAGQEVVRWFFHVGKASATVAKSISAYDTKVSDELYGATAHYVSRERLESMLEHEYALLRNREEPERGEQTRFFVSADTAATHTLSGRRGGHAWLGVRFQWQPGSQPSEIVAPVELLDLTVLDQQARLGILGVNLVHGAFFYHSDPAALIATLMDGLHPRRAEIDLIKLSGPAFPGVDNRLMALQLVEQNLTGAAMFTVDGDVEQSSETLSGRAGSR